MNKSNWFISSHNIKCGWWSTTGCPFGQECCFTHTGQGQSLTNVCRFYFLFGSCPYESDCQFVHQLNRNVHQLNCNPLYHKKQVETKTHGPLLSAEALALGTVSAMHRCSHTKYMSICNDYPSAPPEGEHPVVTTKSCSLIRAALESATPTKVNEVITMSSNRLPKAYDRRRRYSRAGKTSQIKVGHHSSQPEEKNRIDQLEENRRTKVKFNLENDENNDQTKQFLSENIDIIPTSINSHTSTSTNPLSLIKKKWNIKNYCCQFLHSKLLANYDPYVAATLFNDDVPVMTHRTTSVWMGGKNVDFTGHENLCIKKLCRKEGDSMVLKFVVWEKDVLSHDDFLGMGTINLTDFFDGNKKQMNAKIQLTYFVDAHTEDVVKAARKGTLKQKYTSDYAGELEISVAYNSKQRFTLEILTANNLRHSDAHNGRKNTLLHVPLSIAIAVSYFIIGILYYHFVENWGIINILYFILTTLTTVGYGDHKSFDQMFTFYFTSIYTIFGWVSMVYVGTFLIFYFIKSIEHETVGLLNSRASCLELQLSIADDDDTKSENGEQTYMCQGYIQVSKKILLKLWPMIIIFSSGVIFCVHLEVANRRNEDPRKLHIGEAIYFITTTIFTVGYGDFIPSPKIHFAATIWLILAMLAMIKLLIEVSQTYIERLKKKQRGSLLNHAFQSRLDFLCFDQDDDGLVSEIEFLTKIMTRLKLASFSDIVAIRSSFKSIDVNSNGLISITELMKYLIKTPNSGMKNIMNVEPELAGVRTNTTLLANNFTPHT